MTSQVGSLCAANIPRKVGIRLSLKKPENPLTRRAEYDII